jgi:hypothetical protein
MLLRRHPNVCRVRNHRSRLSLARGLRQRARVRTTKGRSASGASGGIPSQADPYRPFRSLERRPRRIPASPTSATISSPGQSITSTITITATGDFSGTVNLSCCISSPTAMLDRSLTPTPVTPDSSTNGTATTLAVTRTGTSGKPGDSVAFLHSGLMILGLAFLGARPAVLCGLGSPLRCRWRCSSRVSDEAVVAMRTRALSRTTIR